MSMIGKTLGHYHITSQIGKGGMGEVYQAKDSKLSRDVAIKVLPEEFAKDADRVARFEREAKLLASLNHPNIAAIYGLEESGGTNFLVLELVEGEALADQLKRGPIPVEESLKLALQIAEALEAAHEKGIIHRDLKPANIKVTPGGKVKVLDFGLAKAFAGGQAEMNLSASPTLSHLATQQGVILGTAAYMSPEQARGRTIDKRTDIWAFGCVLYEMLTGQAAFQGEDVTEILAAVVKGGANLDLLPANLRPRVREAIVRCLQKDLKKRYRDIGDVQLELEQIAAEEMHVPSHSTESGRRHSIIRSTLLWVTATFVIAAVLGGTAIWKIKRSYPSPVVRFAQGLPENQNLMADPRQNGNLSTSHCIAISHDGTRIAYAITGGICLRFLNRMDAKIIVGTEGESTLPFFSPDGQWLGFWSARDRKLKKVSVSGGTVLVICDADRPANAIWDSDNTIIYDTAKGFVRVHANGGTPAPLFEAKKEDRFYDPQVLPDRKTLLFTYSCEPRQMDIKIATQSFESGQRKVLFAGQHARLLPNGFLAYVQNETLFAIPFDSARSEVTGEPFPMLQDIYSFGIVHYAVSDSGTLIYVPRNTAEAPVPPSPRTLVWVDKNGKEEAIPVGPGVYNYPSISPDGTRIAMSMATGGNQDIWIWDLTRKAMTRLTFDGQSTNPIWTLDGKRIAFSSARNETRGVYWKPADGTGTEELLSPVEDLMIRPYSWSRDGKNLIAMYRAGGMVSEISALSLEGERKWRSLLKRDSYQSSPRISPDGRWMAYASNESGKDEVYVCPYPGVDGGRWQVSSGGGSGPLWSPDGSELFYRAGDAIMSVPVITEPTFSMKTPKTLFHGTYFAAWDRRADGKSFLMMKSTEKANSLGYNNSLRSPLRQINIIVNWIEELKQRVPVK